MDNIETSKGLKPICEIIHQHFGVLEDQCKREEKKCSFHFFEVEKGKIKAKLQRGQQKPVYVEVGVRAFEENLCDRILGDIVNQPLWLAKLRGGTLPDTIDQAFQKYDVSLSLTSTEPLNKKITGAHERSEHLYYGSVVYRFFLDFQKDPFLLFRLRGFDVAKIKENFKLGREAHRVDRNSVDDSSKASLNEPPFKYWGDRHVVGLADLITYDRKDPLESLYKKLPFLAENAGHLRKIYDQLKR